MNEFPHHLRDFIHYATTNLGLPPSALSRGCQGQTQFPAYIHKIKYLQKHACCIPVYIFSCTSQVQCVEFFVSRLQQFTQRPGRGGFVRGFIKWLLAWQHTEASDYWEMGIWTLPNAPTSHLGRKGHCLVAECRLFMQKSPACLAEGSQMDSDA